MCVYCMQGNPRLVLVSRYGEDEHGDRAEVPLLFHGGGHYDLLLSPPLA
jgi:hypothetical protein